MYKRTCRTVVGSFVRTALASAAMLAFSGSRALAQLDDLTPGPVMSADAAAEDFAAAKKFDAEVQARVVPITALNYWNRDQIRSFNNCYNYATNRETDSYAQPGESAGRKYRQFTCQAITAAVQADQGIVPTRVFPLSGQNQDTLLALVLSPGDDFHWYRRDQNGLWSHKPGGWPATTLDNSGHTITSPETADRGRYTQFCGYFKVKNYRYRDDLQNGGYVRIGLMDALPELPSALAQASPSQSLTENSPLNDVSEVTGTSEVEILMYSGRPNPRMPLKDALADERIAKMLQVTSTQVAGVVEATLRAVSVPFLGHAGIAVHDREGLVFSQGTEVLFPTSAMVIDDETHPAALGNALQELVSQQQAESF